MHRRSIDSTWRVGRVLLQQRSGAEVPDQEPDRWEQSGDHPAIDE